MKLQLAWLDQGMDELESQVRLESYLEAGLDPELAAAAVSVELYQDEVRDLRERITHLEETLERLAMRFPEIAED
jgi:hypothetical protein